MDEVLPRAILAIRDSHPWVQVAAEARQAMMRRSRSLSPFVDAFPEAAFGLSSGFFYLPAAQGAAWGLAPECIRPLLRALALGHFHFSWQDRVIDESSSDAMMCLLSDVGLLGYLESLESLAGDGETEVRRLHSYYYDRYAAAIVRDLRHRPEPLGYGAAEILGLGDKAAPGATVMHVVADLVGRPASGKGASEALLRLCTGLQLLDDVSDAPHDCAVGNMTWPVTAALLAYPGLAPGDPEQVRAAVLGSGVEAACVRLAIKAFEDAEAQALTTGADVLAELARNWKRRTLARSATLSASPGSLALGP